MNGIWLGAAFPRFPKDLSQYLSPKEGRCITWLGPRFRMQDQICMTHHGGHAEEQLIAKTWAQVSVGACGWVHPQTIES